MTTTNKILAFTAVALGAYGVYYFVKRKSTPAAPSIDGKLLDAMKRFSQSSPVGATNKELTQAEVDKGYAYLQKTLTPTQKQMFIDYSNSFMGGLEAYATSEQAIKDAQKTDSEEPLSGLFTVLANTQDMLEKKYGKDETAKFMIFMNSFKPKELK